MNRTQLSEHLDLDNRRRLTAFFSLLFGIGLVTILNYTLPDEAAKIILDRGGAFYPFSIQTITWVVFSIGLGEILVRFFAVRGEIIELHQRYLPEDPRTVLTAADLPEIYRKLSSRGFQTRRFLPRLLSRCILQFQASQSTDQSAALMNTSLELFIHEIDLRYNMLRYISWLIPSLGFIGTMIGIAQALAVAGDPANAGSSELLTKTTSSLAVAFNTTMLSLVLASILVFLQNIVQSREENALNVAGHYCLDYLINRLYPTPPLDRA